MLHTLLKTDKSLIHNHDLCQAYESMEIMQIPPLVLRVYESNESHHHHHHQPFDFRLMVCVYINCFSQSDSSHANSDSFIIILLALCCFTTGSCSASSRFHDASKYCHILRYIDYFYFILFFIFSLHFLFFSTVPSFYSIFSNFLYTLHCISPFCPFFSPLFSFCSTSLHLHMIIFILLFLPRYFLPIRWFYLRETTDDQRILKETR